jgi:hypothetical protein
LQRAGLQEIHLFQLLLILLFLFVSLLPFSLLMSTVPHIFTTQETHTKTKKEREKTKPKEEQRDYKNLK